MDHGVSSFLALSAPIQRHLNYLVLGVLRLTLRTVHLRLAITNRPIEGAKRNQPASWQGRRASAQSSSPHRSLAGFRRGPSGPSRSAKVAHESLVGSSEVSPPRRMMRALLKSLESAHRCAEGFLKSAFLSIASCGRTPIVIHSFAGRQ